MPESPEAQALVTAVEKQISALEAKAPGLAQQNPDYTLPRLGLRQAVGDMVVTERDTLLVRDEHGNRAEFALLADGPVEVNALKGAGGSIVSALEGTNQAQVERTGSTIVYRSARRATDLLYRVARDEVQELLYLHDVNAPTRFIYKLQLKGALVALRQVGQTIEVLDAEGAPRLRANPMKAVDAEGHVLAVNAQVVGCPVDRSPAAPWGRTIARATGGCRLVVDIATAGAKFPVVVDPDWAQTNTMSVTRVGHNAQLMTNGKVLIAGGRDNATPQGYHKTAELFDSQTGTWAATGSMNIDRTGFVMAALATGKVLVAGGSNGSFPIASNATGELYNPTLGTWSYTSPMNSQHNDAGAAVLLSNGNVLVAGGATSAAGTSATTVSEVYDPGNNSWKLTGALNTALRRQYMVRLPSGKVLAAGGIDATGSVTNASEIFDPAANSGIGTWTASGNMATALLCSGAVVLADGKVGVFGGSTSGGNTAVVGTVQIFDPAGGGGTGTWAGGTDELTPRYANLAVALANGSVMVAGGQIKRVTNATDSTAVEHYDPVGSSWSAGDALTARHGSWKGAYLPGGKFLLTGGDAFDGSAASMPTLNASNIAEIFTPPSATVSAALKPVITSSTLEANSPQGTTVTMNGTLFRGLGTAVGGSDCTPSGMSDLPLVVLTKLGSGAVTVVPSTGWSTGDTLAFTIPTTQPPGDYTIHVEANGVASTQTAFRVVTANANACSTGTECISGFCVGGICCNSACTGACNTCATGTCTPVQNGVNPGGNTCGSGTCAGSCNGAGACGNYPGSALSCATCKVCDGAGACTANAVNSTPCADNTVCNGLEVCVNGTCTAGTALDCNDQLVCTTDSCNPVNGCVNAPVGGGCLEPDMLILDMVQVPDMTIIPDLRVVPDLISLPDLRTVPDLVSLPDLTTAPDLGSQPDLKAAPDLRRNDLAGADAAAAAPPAGCGCNLHAKKDTNRGTVAAAALGLIGLLGLRRRRRAE